MQREWVRLAAEDGALCREKLGRLGVEFRALGDQDEPDARGCGIPHGVVVSRGPTGIAYTPPLQIDCSFALELLEIEREVQEEAEHYLDSRVRSVTTFGSFSCRDVRGTNGKLSEHALGNAIDIGAFTPEQGKPISVARDYPLTNDASGAPGSFLRAVFQKLRESPSLTYVLGPETRADHHDHFHVDRAEPWWQRARPSAQPTPSSLF